MIFCAKTITEVYSFEKTSLYRGGRNAQSFDADRHRCRRLFRSKAALGRAGHGIRRTVQSDGTAFRNTPLPQDAPATRACLVQALYRMEHAPVADTVLTFQDVAEDASFLTAVRGVCPMDHHRLQRHGISPRHLTYARAVRRYAVPLCRIQKSWM